LKNNLSALLIEDDKYVANYIAVSLRQEGYRVENAKNAVEGMFLFVSNHPDIVLLDLGLPDRNGIELIRDIRANFSTPIIVVSATDAEATIVEALDLGADDYLTKPFYMGELLARLRVINRNIGRRIIPTEQGEFVRDRLRVNFEKRRVTVDGQEVHLTPIEYRLLLLLIANAGKVLTHNFITREVWGYSDAGDTRTIRVFMSNLRRKIEKDMANPQFILTEIGVGYRFADDETAGADSKEGES